MTGNNKKIPPKQFFFADGMWMPQTDPFMVGEKNFADIQNLRYREGYLEMVKGYTDVVSSNVDVSHKTQVEASGHIITPFTKASYILAEVGDRLSPHYGYYIVANTGTVPHTTPSDFDCSTPLFTHATNVAYGRFANYPQNHIAYTNANGSYVWAGEEMHFAYVGLTADGETFSEFTDQAKTDSSSTDESVPLSIMVESTSQGTDANVLKGTGAYNKYAVRFLATHTGTIQAVTLRLKKTGSPTGHFHAAIFSESGSLPSAGIGAESDAVDFTGITTSFANYVFTFSSPPAVIEGSYYWVVVDTDSYTYGASDYVEVASYDSSEQTDGAAAYNVSWAVLGHATLTLFDFQVFYVSYLYLGSTRPLQGGKAYITTADKNIVTAAINGYVTYWDIDSFTTVGTVTDNTASSGKTMAATGTFTFPSTLTTANVLFVDERILYFYRMGFSTFLGAAVKANGHYGVPYAYKITANAEFQQMTNIWSGEYQPPLAVLYYVNTGTKWFDQTMWVIEDDPETYTTDAPYTTPIVGLTWASADAMYIVTNKRAQGFSFHFLAKCSNITTSRTITVERYQNGGWVESAYVLDKTSVGTAAWNTTGVVWITPDEGDTQTSVHGSSKGYAYRITFNGALTTDGGGIRIYYLQVIEAPETIKADYAFPFMFRDRPMLCGYQDADEGYRVDYGMANTVDSFNGDDSSFGLGKSPLYFGSSGNLNAACELFSMLSSNLYHFAIFTKVNETYILDGYDADTWKIYKMSGVTGCAAPGTMDTAQITTEQGTKTIAVWVSMTGPVMCDAATVLPIKGLEKYFDPNESVCVNFDSLTVARGWFDPENNEYNLLLPSGSTQTTNNLWVFYSFTSNRWYKKVPAAYPCHIQRVMDAYGRHYAYGFFSAGEVRRLEYGNTWDGTAISPYVKTGEILPSGDLWDVTRLCRIKAISRAMTAARTISIDWYKDGTSTAVNLGAPVFYSTASYLRATLQIQNRYAYTHAFKFTPAYTAGDILPRLYAWSMEYEIEREDIV